MLNIILIVSVIFCVVSAGNPPLGSSYCGSYENTDKIKVTVVSQNSISIIGKIHEGLIACASESVVFQANGAVTFPFIQSNGDCLGSLLKSQNINISLLQVTYNSVTDSASVVGPNGVSYVLKNDCPQREDDFFAPPAAPSGSYCGSYLDSLKGKVTFLSGASIKIVGTAFGNDVSCPTETVTFVPASSTVSFPNIKSGSDCLANLLKSYSVDPAAVKVNYVSARDLLKVTLGSTVFNMTKCPTTQIHYGADFVEEKYPVIIGDPTGSYCGSYSDIVTDIKATVIDPTDCTLTANVYGSAIDCKEIAKYYSSNNSVVFPNILAPNDCLGANLQNFGLDPSALAVTYDPSSNSLEIGVAGISITLTPAQCTFIKAVPSGSYCGSVPNVITVKATIISLSVISLSGSIYGTVNPPCPHEAVALLSDGTIKFPDILAPTDCLGALLRSYSIDPAGVNARYFPIQDVIELTVLGNVFNMTKPACAWK